ncbi:MAG: polysaccharide biosynthesis tyrosine autokinase [Paludibacter sp.]|nr:polysaccharide biosynthesis tyrosine autokinase [Paludibacter sp.]
MEQENIYTTNNVENEETLSFSEFIKDYVKQWKWFVISLVVCLIVAGCYLLIAQRQYSTRLSILIDVDRRSSASASAAQSMMNMSGVFNMSTNNLDNEMIILHSPDLMRIVVDTLHLESSYYIVQRMRKTELYNNTPILAQIINTDSAAIISSANFYVKKNKNNFKVKGSYYFKKDEIDFEKEINNISEKIPLSRGAYIELQMTGKPMEEGEKYFVNIRSALATAYGLCGNLGVEQSTKMSSILNVSLKGNNTGKNAVILRELINQYNLMNVNIKNEIAYSTAVFINDRLNQISNELGDAESNIVAYKQQNKITNLQTEAQLFVQQSGQNEQKLLDVETQLNIISYIQQFINDPANQKAVIPNIGVTDIGLSQMINNYNTALLQNEVQMKGMTQENPRYQQLAQSSENARSSIVNSLNTMKQTYNVTKNDLMRQLAQNRARIQSVPQQEMGLLGKDREQQIKQNLFLFLMQKREETNLTIASTPNKARIVISPLENTAPVAPRKNMILLAALIIGLLIPFAIIYITKLFKTQISSRHDLEKLSQVSIVGQIAKNTTDNLLVVEKNQATGIGEMFRSLRNNINFIFNNKTNKVIITTSTTKHEGKTFVSANLAVSYAFSGKKTLLIGADIRNPKLKKYFTFTKRDGLCNYLAQEDDWHNYLNKLDIAEDLHIIHAGSIPPNPNELLMSPMFGKLIEEAKSEYDFIIIDCAPVGLVSDGYLVAEFADLTLYIVREGVTPKDSVYFINQQKAENKLKNMYLVLNSSSLDGTYKYGYGKEYGYN